MGIGQKSKVTDKTADRNTQKGDHRTSLEMDLATMNFSTIIHAVDFVCKVLPAEQ